MGFFEIAPPRAEYVILAKYIILVVSLLFVTYISILLGTTLLSVGFSYRGKTEENPIFIRFSKDLMDTLTGNFSIALVLGVLPVFTLSFSYSEILYNAGIEMFQYMMVVMLLVLGGLVLVNRFKKSFVNRDDNSRYHYFMGLAAAATLSAAMYAFISSVTVLTFPEKWPLLETLIPMPFDWNMMARYSHFLTASLAITGAAILFFFFNWMGGKEGLEEDYRQYIKKFGGGLALGFTIIQTLFLMWYFVTLPEMAKSHSVYSTAFFSLILLWLICYLLYSLLRNSKLQYGSPVFILNIVFFLIVLVGEHQARENALVYQNYALEQIAVDFNLKIETARAQQSGAAASIELGDEIYANKCIACHKFDQRVVGPPYLEVLPKYKNNIIDLKQFILNPVKVDPAYPNMPNQGLKPHEAESVAMYLFEKAKEFSE